LYVILKEKRHLSSIGIAFGKFFRDIYIGLGFGMVFALQGLIANSIKYGSFVFAPIINITGINIILVMVLSIVSAFVEELLVRGFLYNRLKEYYKNELKAMFVSTLMYFLLLLPGIFTISHLMGVSLVIFIMTNIIVSFANTMIFNETKTLTTPVLIHAFWNMAVALYL
jgi:membrane protease YdiL (CAAX protease family)